MKMTGQEAIVDILHNRFWSPAGAGSDYTRVNTENLRDTAVMLTARFGDLVAETMTRVASAPESKSFALLGTMEELDSDEQRTALEYCMDFEGLIPSLGAIY